MNAQEIIAELNELGSFEKAEHSKRFFKNSVGEYGEGDIFWGIKVPEQRKIARKYKDMSLPEVEILLQHPVHEVRLTALLLLGYKVEKENAQLLKEVTELYLNNLPAINNWDLVDSSAPHILGRYLQDKERSLLYEFARSENLWKRRISILSCFYFIRRHDFQDALSISEILLSDEHDLIHKATGWMLREIGNRDGEVEEQFLKKHYSGMPRTMLRYAIEKFDEPLRQKYLKGSVKSPS